MKPIDFGFVLFEYSLVLIVIGMVLGMLLRLSEQGWPKARKRWAYPLLFTCFGFLLLTSVIRFVEFVQAFSSK